MSSPSQTNLLPELALDTTTRLVRLTHLADRAWNATRRLIGISRVNPGGVERHQYASIFSLPSWGELRPAELPVADSAAASVRAWLEAAERVIKLNQIGSLAAFQKHSAVLTSIADRTSRANRPSSSDSAVVTRASEKAFIAQLDLLSQIPAARQPTVWMWLPDTNALYDRHELHRWPAAKPTFLVVAPAVVSELDAHKQDGRNPGRQAKARTLSDQIKDIRRRPDRVIRGKLRLSHDGTWHRAWDELPEWLDRGHSDDQILALGIQLSWTSLTSAVTLITSDANLQAKAERVGLAYVDQDSPSVLVAPAVPDPMSGIYYARQRLIYANFHRGPGDRFLAVAGEEAMLKAHLASGAAERT